MSRSTRSKDRKSRKIYKVVGIVKHAGIRPKHLRLSLNNVKLFAAKPRITKKIEEEWSEAERPEADEIFFCYSRRSRK